MALREHDEKHVRVARENLTDVRDLYAVMTDLIHKNITKVRVWSVVQVDLLTSILRRSGRQRATMPQPYTNKTTCSGLDARVETGAYTEHRIESLEATSNRLLIS